MINSEKCTGCGICMQTCAVANFRPPVQSAIRVILSAHMKNVSGISICYSCEEPGCAAACPTGYIEKKEEGGVRINRKNECIACRNCVEHCNYSYLECMDSGEPLLCRQCGLCAVNCPNDVLIMVKDDE